MNFLVTISLALLGAAVAEPGYYHHGYGGYGHGYGYGKREAEPAAVAEADAEPGYYHHGYSHARNGKILLTLSTLNIKILNTPLFYMIPTLCHKTKRGLYT